MLPTPTPPQKKKTTLDVSHLQNCFGRILGMESALNGEGK